MHRLRKMALGRRRLHTNTDYIVLASVAARVTSLALGWRTLPPPGLFLTLGKVNCHRPGLGVGAKIDLFFREKGGRVQI